MDTTQLLLTIVLTVSTVLLVIIGIQLIFILKELRQTLRHVNKIIDGFESLGTGLEHGLTEVTGFMNGFKMMFKAIDLMPHKKNEKQK
ncbi:MAG: hypothetical protein Q7S61_04740 [bacterium]|nr:hypothetical protein [bacterium]